MANDLVTNWGSVLLSAVLPLGLAALLAWIWRAQRGWKGGHLASLGGLLAVSLLVVAGCGRGPGERPAEKAGRPAAQTALEQVLTHWQQNQSAAVVESFLRLDLTQGSLFSPGTALSHGEAEFIALPEAARQTISKQALSDLGALKSLAARVREVRQEALARGDTAQADACARQLRQLGERLDQPETLAIARLVGKALRKMGETAPAAAPPP